jgi:hypothetical protein
VLEAYIRTICIGPVEIIMPSAGQFPLFVGSLRTLMDTGDLAYNVKLSVCCWEGQRRIEIGELSRAKKCEA